MVNQLMYCGDCNGRFLSENEGDWLCRHCARDREEGEDQDGEEKEFDAQEETVEGAEEEAFEAGEGGSENAEEEAEKARPLQRFTPEDVINNPERCLALFPVELALQFNKAFLRLPQTWVKGRIPALMDGTSRGLWTLFTHLWHYGNLPQGLIFPAKGRLARDAGFKSPRTLHRKLEILETGDTKTGLPALLEPLSPKGKDRHDRRVRYLFKPDGLARLQLIAQVNIEADERQRTAISKARRKAGRIGARKRWR